MLTKSRTLLTLVMIALPLSASAAPPAVTSPRLTLAQGAALTASVSASPSPGSRTTRGLHAVASAYQYASTAGPFLCNWTPAPT